MCFDLIKAIERYQVRQVHFICTQWEIFQLTVVDEVVLLTIVDDEVVASEVLIVVDEVVVLVVGRQSPSLVKHTSDSRLNSSVIPHWPSIVSQLLVSAQLVSSFKFSINTEGILGMEFWSAVLTADSVSARQTSDS